MSEFTRAMEVAEVEFAPGATSAELRLTTEDDIRNEGDGEIRASIIGSDEYPYAIGSPARRWCACGMTTFRR